MKRAKEFMNDFMVILALVLIATATDGINYEAFDCLADTVIFTCGTIALALHQFILLKEGK